jgi:hypothetical protein
VSQEGDDGSSVESTTAIERPLSPAAGQGALAPGTILAGRYEVRGAIGRGGMGLVVEARDRTLGVTVAIKIVRAELAGEREWSERLAREVKLARQIQHPNVCRVFDFAQADGPAFLIMELATGGTLRDELRAATARARPLADRISDARALAAGLAAIHASGIVHRDISPQNALRMGDGRLVLSDFGLATDSFDGTTSIHGGTVAYMAPEVLRGGRANVASDLWALGAVIHEVVFGERLQWSAQSAAMRSAVDGRRLSPIERSVLEICRACLAADPARRPRGAAEIAAQLSDAGLARSAGRRARRRATLIVAAAGVAVLAVIGAKRIETSRKHAALTSVVSTTPRDPLMIIPTGEPDDWTDKSKILAEIPDRVRCMVRLPDHHTVRLVWGYPPHAEDIDTRTGKRSPSPLVADAYAEGCPDVSADGKRLVYTGHTADDRAFAFVSSHADGSAAVPVVPIAEPSMSSDPTWLPDGTKFLYEVDARHLAVFSTITRRSLILPSAEHSVVSAFHAVVGEHVYASAELGDLSVDITGFTPALDQVVHFRLPHFVVGIEGSSDERLFCWSGQVRLGTPLIEVDPKEGRARESGFVRSQYSKCPRLVTDGLTFLSARPDSEVVRVASDGRTLRTAVGPQVQSASRCGSEVVATVIDDGKPTVARLDIHGHPIQTMGERTYGFLPTCSPDGKVLYYMSLTPSAGIRRCEGGRCREVVEGLTGTFSLSPEGDRIAFFESSNSGLSFRWIWSDGHGSSHEITESAAGCAPEWSSNDSLWLSTRSGRQVIWREFKVGTGGPTGRTSLGSRDCSDGLPDPLAPVRHDVSLDVRVTTQVRLLLKQHLRPARPTVGASDPPL